jgi:hypothetical protein
MSKVWIATGLTLALAATSGCFGKSEQQKKQEEAAQAMKDAAAKMEAAGKDMEKGGAKAAEAWPPAWTRSPRGSAPRLGRQRRQGGRPVSFRDLQATFVPLAGWEMAKPTGERMSSPFAYSQAEVSYSKGDGRIHVKIVDSAYNA